MEFKGTPGKWIYKRPTERFDASTIGEKGKVIGYAAKNSIEDMYNERLRSKAPEMLDLLNDMYKTYSDNERITGSLRDFMIKAKQLIKEATTI